METFLIVGLAVLASVFVTARVCAGRFKRQKDEEDRNRRDRSRTKLALENELLRGGARGSRAAGQLDSSLRSLGNVRYLIWLLNYEPAFRNFSGEPGNQYLPDWEWRREFVFLREGEECQAQGCTSAVGVSLDCHHIRPISNFTPGERGIHALSNLVTLCASCHATQHPRNLMLKRRAEKNVAQKHAPRGSAKIASGSRSHTSRPFKSPREIEIFTRCGPENADSAPPRLNPDRREEGSVEAVPPNGIKEGLAMIDAKIASAYLGEPENSTKSGSGNSLEVRPGKHPRVELEKLEAKLKTTTQPMVKRLLEIKAQNLRNEICAKYGVEPLDKKADQGVVKAASVRGKRKSLQATRSI